MELMKSFTMVVKLTLAITLVGVIAVTILCTELALKKVCEVLSRS